MFRDIDSEIQDVIEDVRFGVKSIAVQQQTARKLLNIITLENMRIEVAVSERGFEVKIIIGAHLARGRRFGYFPS